MTSFNEIIKSNWNGPRIFNANRPEREEKWAEASIRQMNDTCDMGRKMNAKEPAVLLKIGHARGRILVQWHNRPIWLTHKKWDVT